jgi:hypothetical protein
MQAIAQPESGESGLEERSNGNARPFSFVNELESMIGGILARVPSSKNPIVRQTEADEGRRFHPLWQARPAQWDVESIAAPEFEGTSNLTSP